MNTHEKPPGFPEPDEAQSEKKEKNVFLEIGTGHAPMTAAFGSRKFTGNDHYVGIDLVTRVNAFGRREEIELDKNKEFAEAIRGQENISFVHSKGTETPFTDESVNEAYISNVFGDPSVDKSVLESIVAEVSRVLKIGGTFTIRENNTPKDAARVSETLVGAGFEVIRIISIGDKDWEKFSSKYHPAQKDFDAPGSYYLVAVKPKRQSLS